MNVYEKLKQSIQQAERDKESKPIKWVAQFQDKDEERGEVIRLGIRVEDSSFHIYFDFDKKSSDGVANSKEESIQQIEQRWGNMKTFKWIKYRKNESS